MEDDFIDPRQIRKMERPDDPERCQGLNHQGQCTNKAVPGGTFCMAHGGNKQLENQEKEKVRNYRLGQFQARLERMADSSILKSLHEEVGLLRMVLESVINKCEDDIALVTNSHIISDLVIKIEKVVTSTTKLEKSMGQHLDKAAILQFASEVINVITEHISDSTIISKIADGILNVAQRMGTDSDESD